MWTALDLVRTPLARFFPFSFSFFLGKACLYEADGSCVLSI